MPERSKRSTAALRSRRLSPDLLQEVKVFEGHETLWSVGAQLYGDVQSHPSLGQSLWPGGVRSSKVQVFKFRVKRVPKVPGFQLFRLSSDLNQELLRLDCGDMA
jgi:hypothetical protein